MFQESDIQKRIVILGLTLIKYTAHEIVTTCTNA